MTMKAWTGTVRPHLAAWAGLQYALFRTGPVASAMSSKVASFGIREKDRSTPDLQFHFLAGAAAEDGVVRCRAGAIWDYAQLLWIAAKGARHRAPGITGSLDRPPLIDPNFMGHAEDVETTVRGLKISRDIVLGTCAWPNMCGGSFCLTIQ
jgi:hypothetical protein